MAQKNIAEAKNIKLEVVTSIKMNKLNSDVPNMNKEVKEAERGEEKNEKRTGKGQGKGYQRTQIV